MRAFLIGASPDETAAHVKQALRSRGCDPARDLLIGVDGGVTLLRKAGLRPTAAIGDWDSWPAGRGYGAGVRGKGEGSGIPRVTLPRGKDRSDLHHAIGLARSAGVDELIALGVTGGRPDHHLAALLELGGEAASRDCAVSALGPEGEYYFLSPAVSEWRAPLARGRMVSIIAFDPGARVSLRGFKYALRGKSLQAPSHGLSNVVAGAGATIRASGGLVLVVVPSNFRRRPRH